MIKILQGTLKADHWMNPDEGGSYNKSMGTIRTFIYLEQGFHNHNRDKYQAAFSVSIAGEEIVFIDDEIFNNWSAAGKKSHIIVSDFMAKFKVLAELLIIPNIKSLDGTSE